MRQILFRGKRLDNREWIHGCLLIYPDSSVPTYYILTTDGHPFYMEKYQVDPATVGQYTGMTDENGIRVFEGDIVKMHHFFENYDPGTLGAFEDEEVLDVVIGIEQYGVSFETLDRKTSGYVVNYLEDPEAELKVIGNRWDNPELLEEA